MKYVNVICFRPNVIINPENRTLDGEKNTILYLSFNEIKIFDQNEIKAHKLCISANEETNNNKLIYVDLNFRIFLLKPKKKKKGKTKHTLVGNEKGQMIIILSAPEYTRILSNSHLFFRIPFHNFSDARSKAIFHHHIGTVRDSICLKAFFVILQKSRPSETDP